MKIYRFVKLPICWLAFLAFANCSSDRHLSSQPAGHFMNSPASIDGDDKEWPSPYPSYDSKAMISYATANDRDNLYISLKAGDERIQRKILAGGLTVWVDPAGQKEELLAIRYPLKGSGPIPSNDGWKGRMAKSDGDRPPVRDTSERSRHEVPMPDELSLSGFDGCSGNFTVTGENGCGIKVRMAQSEYGEFVWEAAVPLKLLYATNLPGGNAAAISIGFEIGGMQMPARQAGEDNGESGGHESSGGHGGHGSGGGGRGHMGGSGGGGHGGQGQGSRQAGEGDNIDLSQATKTWTKAWLVTQ